MVPYDIQRLLDRIDIEYRECMVRGRKPKHLIVSETIHMVLRTFTNRYYTPACKQRDTAMGDNMMGLHVSISTSTDQDYLEVC